MSEFVYNNNNNDKYDVIISVQFLCKEGVSGMPGVTAVRDTLQCVKNGGIIIICNLAHHSLISHEYYQNILKNEIKNHFTCIDDLYFDCKDEGCVLPQQFDDSVVNCWILQKNE